MLKNERKREILRQLLEDGQVRVEQLAERFETSMATIRPLFGISPTTEL